MIGFGSTPNGKTKVKTNGKRDAALAAVTLPDEEDEEDEEEENEEPSASFGDRLRASKDQDSEEGSEEERGLNLKEQEGV